MPASLKEISSLTGLSISTVSACLNGKAKELHINAQTCEKVLKIAAGLGYRPQAHARQLRAGGKANAIALIQPMGYGPRAFSVECLNGIHEELMQRDVPLVSGLVSDEMLMSSENMPRLLKEWLADGMLLNYIYRYPPELPRFLRSFKIPCVWMNANHEFDCVCPDDFNGAVLATESLLALGHKRVAFIAPSTSNHYSLKARTDGYMKVMREASLPACVSSYDPSNDRASFYLNWIASNTFRPSAIVTCYSEGDGVKMAALKLGIKVPEELSIISFLDSFRGHPDICVSYMRIPFYETGRSAVKLLLEKIANQGPPVPAQTIPYSAPNGATLAPPLSA